MEISDNGKGGLEEIKGMLLQLLANQKNFEDSIKRRIDGLNEMVHEKIDSLMEKVDNLNCEVKKEIDEVRKECIKEHSELIIRIDECEKKIEDMSQTQESNSSCIVVKGYPNDLRDDQINNYCSAMIDSLNIDPNPEIKRTEKMIFGEKYGPIKVTLNSPVVRKQIIRKKRRLKDIEPYKNVFIEPCMNEMELQLNRKLRILSKYMPTHERIEIPGSTSENTLRKTTRSRGVRGRVT